jgi:hypothetical protein
MSRGQFEEKRNLLRWNQLDLRCLFVFSAQEVETITAAIAPRTRRSAKCTGPKCK